MEQNILPLLWHPLSTVALILVVIETASRDGYLDEDGPEGGSAIGRGEGFSRAQGEAEEKLQSQGNDILTVEMIHFHTKQSLKLERTQHGLLTGDLRP